HLIPLPRLGTAIGMVNFILRDAGLKERRFPFLTEYACGVSEEFRLELDAALGEPAALPTFETMDTPTLHWDLALDWSGRTLTGKGLFTIDTPEVSPAAYLEMKESLKTLEIQGRKQPIFRKTAEAWAGADSVVLERVTEIELKDATHWSRLDRVRRRILTYKGKKDHAELSWQYNPSWETVEVVRAAVTAADGTVKVISPEEINTMDASWVASAPRYPAGRTLVASLPGVEVGCTLEVEVRSTASGGPFFATRHRFGGFDPAQRQVLRLRAPAGLSVRVGEVHGGLLAPDGDTIQSTHRRQGDLVETEWTVLDQPAVVREDGLPPLECLVPTVLISAGEWKDYARELRRAMDRAAEGGLEVRLLAGKARERHRDPAALVQALRDLVVTRVRAAGPSLPELPTAAISAADVTLRDGYGNSADVAVLLGALLRAAGLRPEWALAAAVPPVPVCEAAARQYPDPGLFPAVLVRVKVPGLGVVYLNDTHQYAALGSTPHDGRLGLALRRGRLERIEALEGSRDAEEVEYVIGLDAAGDAEVTYRRQSRGGLYAAENRRFSEMPPEERRRYFEEAIAGLSQSAEARSELLTDFTAQPGREGFSAWVRAMAVRDGDYLTLNLPRSLRQLMGLRADTRREPLFWSAPRRLRLAFEVVLPPEFNEVVLKPQEMVWEAPEQAGTVRTTVTRPEPGRLQVVHEVDLRPAILPAAAYPELLETHRRLSHPAAATLLLRRQPAAAAP
ncbi:MAG: DUF3857 domain-containing protein, partial [Lentisphaerae bacterium]|nr:DUF3857 domain-containing protein [Lentisphaerota bacterium]